MTLSNNDVDKFVAALKSLSPAQQERVLSIMEALSRSGTFCRAEDSDVVTDKVLAYLGDQLLIHHAGSRQALSKDRFEFALESALNAAKIPAALAKSRTNPGHDITIKDCQVSLKTEAAATIKDDVIHVSKWMELGKGEWELSLLRSQFLQHMQNYDRIFTFRRLKDKENKIRYELIEIPKKLLLEAKDCKLEIRTNSKQNPKPGYGYVRDEQGNLKYSLYFDGGSERKLQIKNLRKDLCKWHASWEISLTPF